MSRRQDDPNIHELARQQAVHEQRISDHDKVLDDIRKHLAQLVAEFAKTRTTVLVGLALLLAGSPAGQTVLERLL